MYAVDLGPGEMRTCSECGSFTRSAYRIMGDGTSRDLCKDCMSRLEGIESPSEVIVFDGSLSASIAEAKCEGWRYNAWYLFGTIVNENGCRRTMVTKSLPWSHDRFGRPVFDPSSSFDQLLSLKRELKMVGVLFTVPYYCDPPSESNRYVLKLSNADLIVISNKDADRATAFRRGKGNDWRPAVIMRGRSGALPPRPS